MPLLVEGLPWLVTPAPSPRNPWKSRSQELRLGLLSAGGVKPRLGQPSAPGLRKQQRGAQPFFAGFLAGAFFAGAGAALAAAFFAGAFLAALGAAFAGAAAFFAAFLAGGGAAAGALLSHTPSAAPAGSMKMPIAPISPISM